MNKQRNRDGNGIESENNIDMGNNNQVVSLQQNLINQTTNPHVTKIRGAPCKKRIKSAIEISGKNHATREITSQTNVQECDDGSVTSRS